MEEGGLCPGPPAPKPPGPPGAEAPKRPGPAHRGVRIGYLFLWWFRSKEHDLFPSAHRVLRIGSSFGGKFWKQGVRSISLDERVRA